MRKALFAPCLFMVLSVCAAFAAETDLGQIEAPGGSVSLDIPPPDVLYDTGYDYGLLITGVPTAPGLGWVSADDMVFEDDVSIDMITAYILVNQAVPDSFDIRFWEDSGNGPGTELDSAPCDCELISTGDYAFGYIVYRAEMVLDTTCELDAGHYWFAGGYTSGYWYWVVQINSYDDMVYFDYGGGGSGPWYSSQYMWGQAYDFFFTINGEAGDPDIEPPFVEGMDPDDGDTGVPVDTDIVFHCVCDLRPVDTDTIVFTVEDQSMSLDGGAVHPGSCLPVLQGNPQPTGEISGTLEIDDYDPLDVVCTFTPDEDLPVDLITCTVDGCLANDRDEEMSEDFVWTFSTGDYAVEETTWGAIKAEF